MYLFILLFAIGLALLLFGAEALVRGASQLAVRFGISEIIIGLVIVAFGTSMPELVVSSSAALRHANDIAIANVVGSNLFNLLLILGISGLIVPLSIPRDMLRRDIPLSFIATLLLLGAGVLSIGKAHQISRAESLIMFGCFAAYIYFLWKSSTRNKQEQEATIAPNAPRPKASLACLLVLVGLGCLIGGGRLVVDNAIAIARATGLSEHLIGSTIVAAGTSVPELATSVVAALRKKNDIAVANVIGSNIFNILFIIPISSMLSPISYSAAFSGDMVWLLAGTAALWLIAFRHGRLPRWGAALLVCTYVAYTILLF